MVSHRPLLFIVLLPLAACGDDPCPRGSMLDSVDGFEMTEAEHPTGWGLEDCSECHALPSLHRLGCSPDVDLELIREQVRDEGLDSCASCHGDNGVLP